MVFNTIRIVDSTMPMATTSRPWLNFIRDCKLNYQTYEVINKVLLEYDALVFPIEYTKVLDRDLIFNSVEGYTKFMLQFS